MANLDQVATDLRAEFPSMKGFSRSNVMYMRAFAAAWPEPEFVQQPVEQIPWGHNLVLLTKLKDRDARLAYAANILKHGWSRAVLVHPIEARTVQRQGKALTNFEQRLPKPQSDLARENLKDPYRFDFLDLGEEADEKPHHRQVDFAMAGVHGGINKAGQAAVVDHQVAARSLGSGFGVPAPCSDYAPSVATPGYPRHLSVGDQ